MKYFKPTYSFQLNRWYTWISFSQKLEFYIYYTFTSMLSLLQCKFSAICDNEILRQSILLDVLCIQNLLIYLFSWSCLITVENLFLFEYFLPYYCFVNEISSLVLQPNIVSTRGVLHLSLIFLHSTEFWSREQQNVSWQTSNLQ